MNRPASAAGRIPHVTRRCRSRSVDSAVQLLRSGPLRPTLSDAAAVRLRHAERAGRVGRAGGARRVDGRRGRHHRPAGVDHQPGTQRGTTRTIRALSAGITFLGQFLDHDMTFDPTSTLARTQDPESIRNFRIPALDLDSVYGGGPGVSPHLYDQTSTAAAPRSWSRRSPARRRCRIDGSVRFDVPRNSSDTRPDRRSAQRREPDRRPAASGVPALPQRRRRPTSGRLGPRAHRDEMFAEAQRIVRWHYQWMILHEFLPLTCGDDSSRTSLTTAGSSTPGVTPRTSRWSSPSPPTASVTRRCGPAIAPTSAPAPPTPRSSSSPSSSTRQRPTRADPDDLRGGCRAPRRFIDWQTFFDFGDGRVRPQQEDRHQALVGRCSTCWASRRAARRRWPPATCCAT